MGIRRGVSWHKLMVDLSFLRRKARQRPPWFHSPAARYTPRVSVPTADRLRTQPAQIPQCRLPRSRSQAEDLPPLDTTRAHLFRTLRRLKKGFSLGTTRAIVSHSKQKEPRFAQQQPRTSHPLSSGQKPGTETAGRRINQPQSPTPAAFLRRKDLRTLTSKQRQAP